MKKTVVGFDVVERRRGRRRLLFGIMTFAMAFCFGFLSQRRYDSDVVEAASLKSFDPGYIISDWQMGNYQSMSEEEIQAFLTRKNPCNNTNYDYYLSLSASASPNYQWHFDNGHFICLSEELFGDGEVIGEGDTAAHILWETAQEYKINPQALIVLLQKETGLITDPIPNTWDYRRATGYGCPDTAPCSSQYYGFKNQVKKAAALFRTVLDGGWTNYPLGENYVQYNPNASCGGSVVNIRSLATSALYRYTPYQPNDGALAAGYGTAQCGAYGNRNFYLYFEDWFGGVTGTDYSNMDTPRYMINTETGLIKMYKFKRYNSDDMCLSDSEKNNDCTPYKKLENVNWEWDLMEVPRYLAGNKKTIRIDLTEKSDKPSLNNTIIYYNKKTVLPDGKQCLLPEDEKYIDWCVVFDTLTEVEFTRQEMVFPRVMEAKTQTHFIDAVTNNHILEVNKGDHYSFSQKIILPNGSVCLVAENEHGCVLESDLMETWNEMQVERTMVVKSNTYKINIYTDEHDESILMDKGMERRYVSKTYYGGEWCLRTEYDDMRKNNKCVLLSKLGEAWEKLPVKENKRIKMGAQKKNAFTLTGGLIMENEESRFFVSRFYVASLGEWCYRSQYDDNLKTDYCFLESDLK